MELGAEQLYGYSAQEAVGRHISLIVPPNHRGELKDFSKRIQEGKNIKPLETVRQRKDGSRVDVSLRISPVRDSKEEVIGVSEIVRDITKLKSVQRRLRKAIRRRDHFLAMLSHELRNPLGAILNAGKIIQSSEVAPEKLAEAQEIIIRQANQISRLLDDLLDVSRIARDKIELRKQVVQLLTTTEGAVQAVQPMIASRNQKLSVHQSEQPIYVYGDPARLQQIQVNLLSNAAKYSPDGETILLTVEQHHEEAVIRVEDNGIGISPELLDEIFEPFVQSNQNLNQTDGGMGVGLTLVKALVELHGGTIAVESEGEGRGSEFTVRIPILSGAIDPREKEETSSRVFDSSISLVIVEDESDNCQTLKTLLEMEGCNVLTAETGRKGVELISNQKPDAALIDIGLPDITGYEVARQIRQDEANQKIHLVALTGYGRSHDIEKSQKAGFNDHIVKPLNTQKLQKAFEVFKNS